MYTTDNEGSGNSPTLMPRLLLPDYQNYPSRWHVSNKDHASTVNLIISTRFIETHPLSRPRLKPSFLLTTLTSNSFSLSHSFCIKNKKKKANFLSVIEKKIIKIPSLFGEIKKIYIKQPTSLFNAPVASSLKRYFISV